MNESRIQLTLAFRDSRAYRAFIARVRPMRSSATGILQGATRIIVRRNPRPREVVLISHGILSAFFFDVGQWINPASVNLLDFDYGPTSDPFVAEFMRCLHACLLASMLCLDMPDDPETFHRFRLDFRAFRSMLKIMDKLEVNGLNDLREKSKLLANASNDLRDADVTIALYRKFDERIPENLNMQRDEVCANVLNQLRDMQSDVMFTALRFIASTTTFDRFQHRFVQYIEKRTKKTAKRWNKIKLNDDAAIHALRIDLKMLSYGYSVMKNWGSEDQETAKSIKSIQSRLGDIRDLRNFYILPGLNRETRFRAVQAMSSIENELEEMDIHIH